MPDPCCFCTPTGRCRLLQTVQLTALEAAAAARYQQQLSRWGWQLHDSAAAASRNQLAATTSSSGRGGVGGSGSTGVALSGGSYLLARVPCVAGVLLKGVDLQVRGTAGRGFCIKVIILDDSCDGLGCPCAHDWFSVPLWAARA